MKFLSCTAMTFIVGIFLAVLNAAENKPGTQIPPGFEMVKGSAEDTNGWASEIRHKDTGLEMVYVAPGEFMMGSPLSEKDRADDQIQHKVKLTKGFYIGKYEVTQGQWDKIMGRNPNVDPPVDPKCKNFPVKQISWNECKTFCEKLGETSSSASAQGGLRRDDGNRFRLPSEAEWEFAARGGNKSKGFIYSGSNNLDEVAWYSSNSETKMHEVGQKKANELGIFDMSGNVWEWCSDFYGEYPSENVTDPAGVPPGYDHVTRGGSWYTKDWRCRIAVRNIIMMVDRWYALGFRLAMDIPISK